MVATATRGSAIGLDILAPGEAEHWIRRLNSTAKPCGCKAGAAFALFAIVCWPVWISATALPVTLLAVSVALATYAGVVVMGAIAGKLTGIIVGRLQHWWVRRRLTRRLQFVAAGTHASG